MNKYIFLFLTSLLSLSSSAQDLNYNIRGAVFDTLDNSLISATALLLEKSDSTLISFARTELDGSFKFKDVKPGRHIVKFTYVGYLPLTIDVSSEDGTDIDLGNIAMEEIAVELMQVVIKAAKASIKIRGDTIEYDASTFQVPEGSSVEDLLKRLPGIEVGQDGSILSEGKDVSKVTVDGKSFFGSDPKVATQNLPAEAISKVQVFDTKSEEDKISASTAESEEKTMNLDLKEEFKKGGFGKIVAGIGTESTAEAKGNYNKFNEKIQFSLVGVGNNTGRNGLNWDDYQDFMGSNSWNFGGNGDYGFGGGGGYYTIRFGGDDAGIESSIQNMFFGGNDRGGFPENYNGGINFNYDHNKNKFSSVYYYNQATLASQTESNRRSFLDEFTINNNNTVNRTRSSRGHRGEFSFEKELDSLHTIIISLDAAAIDQTIDEDGNTILYKDEDLTTISSYDNVEDTDGYLLNTQAIFRKKFKKKKRKMGLNALFQTSELNNSGIQDAIYTFLDPNGLDSTAFQNQITTNKATKNLFKANALYVEPITKKIFLQTFYNFNRTIEKGDREVDDVLGSDENQNEFLSRVYENNIIKNRVGTSLMYSHNGVNISLGGAYQKYDIDGDFLSKNELITGRVDKVYENWIPNLSIRFSPQRNSNISIGFTQNVDAPTVKNLRPIIDNSNPLFITEGNADLQPVITNRVSFNYSLNFPANGIRIGLRSSYSKFTDQVIDETTIDDNLVTYTRPVNYSGGDNSSVYTNFSFPIIRNKFTVRTTLRVEDSKSFAFVNDDLNTTQTLGLRPSVRLNITPIRDLAIYINANWNRAATSYDISTSEDQTTLNSEYDIEFNAKTFAGIYINSNFRYSIFKNDRFNVDQDVPVLNVSLYKQFLPKKALEVRISLYDAFNENVKINQSTFRNTVSESKTEALGRYLMLSLSYNIRGMKAGVKKDGWW